MVMDVTIFSTAGEREAIWRKVDGVHGTEMTVDLRERLRENHTLQTNLEATGTLVGKCDISRVLPTAHEDVELLPLCGVVQWADGDGTARSIAKAVLTNLFKCFRVQ